MAFTVTATQGGSTGAGFLLRVKVLTQAAASQAGAAAVHVNHASGTAPQLSITTTVTGSQVYGAIVNDSNATAYTANGSTTLFDNLQDTANNEYYATCRTTSATGTPGPVTVGASAPSNAANGVVLLEILPSGTITEDGSSPAAASTFGAGPVTTASFTPPAGSLLVAMISSDGGAGVTTFAVTDTSGLGLNWIEASKANASGGDYAGVWTAFMPGGSSAAALAAQPGITWRRFFRHLQQPASYPSAAAPPATAPPATATQALPGKTWQRFFRHPQQPAAYPPGPVVDYYTSTYTSLYGGPETPITVPQYVLPGSAWRRFFRHPQQPLPAAAPAQQPAGAPVYPLQHPVAAAARPLPQRGRAQNRAGIYGQAGPPLTPPKGPVRARLPLLPLLRGTCRSMSSLVVTVIQAAAPFIPQGLIAAKSRGFPPRGRSQGRTGTYQGTGPVVAPLQQPAGVRVIRARTGGSLSVVAAPQPAGSPFYALNHPAAARTRPLPPRGRAQGRAGTFTAVVQAAAAFYPLNQPARARIPQPSWRGTCRSMAVLTATVVPSVTAAYPLARPVATPARGFPPRGTARWRYGTFTQITSVTVAYPFRHPAAAVTRPLPPRGQVRSNPGVRGQAGPAVYPQQHALRVRLPQQPFLKGRTSGNAGVYDQPGPKVYALRGPVSPVTRGFPPRGRAAGRAGTFTAVVQAGPPVYPLHSPVAAVIRPLPPRGRTAGRAGVFRGSGPAVKPLQHPVYAWRPGPRRGVCLTSITPPPASGTGSKFYPLRKPATARRLPRRPGSAQGRAGLFQISPALFVMSSWAPRTAWETGEPALAWDANAPQGAWRTASPLLGAAPSDAYPSAYAATYGTTAGPGGRIQGAPRSDWGAAPPRITP